MTTQEAVTTQAIVSTNEIVRLELRAAVTIEIRNMILSGEVAPGQRLVETELAARFGTSRGPVRDALADLERSGLVLIKNRRGSFVVELTAEDVDELYSLRLALEELAVRKAAINARPDDVRRMRSDLTAIGTALLDGEADQVGEADMRLHRTIVSLAAHQRLSEAWERLADQTLLMMRYLTHTRPEIQGDRGEHGAIIDAIADHDPDRAAQALGAHLEEARMTVRRQFAQRS